MLARSRQNEPKIETYQIRMVQPLVNTEALLRSEDKNMFSFTEMAITENSFQISLRF